MESGILAGVLFLVLGWLTFKVGNRIEIRERQEIFWAVSAIALILYGLLTIVMWDTCGTLGSMLLMWVGTILAAVLALGGLYLVLILSVFSAGTAYTVVENASPGVVKNTRIFVVDATEKTLVNKKSWFLGAVAFIAFCGWMGSQPNPNCKAMVIDPSIVEIRVALEESSPELVEEFNRLINK